MYKNLLITLFFICLFLPIGYSAYYPNRKILLPDNVFEIDYSPQQVYMGAATRSLFVLYSGHTGKELQNFTIETNISFTSFGFSRDNSWLALGHNDGTVTMYEYDSETRSFKSQQEYKGDIQSDVTGVCFSPDNKFVVIGLRQDRIAVRELKTKITVEKNFYNEFVFTVSCSPSENTFVVGGGQSTLAQLALFEID